jgi:anti-sigma B factor antagonist
MEFSIREEQIAGAGHFLMVQGRLDAITAPQIKARLKELVAVGHRQLVVDLVDVSFIDSSGLSALVAGFKAAREVGGTLKLAGLNEQTRTAFQLSRLDRVFEFYPDDASQDASAGERSG